MIAIKDFEMPMECRLCPFAIPSKRRFGTTWACQAEITFMDVTHHYNNCQKSKLCPLIELGEEPSRTDTIDECISKIDKLTTYYAGDKDGNAITPKVVIKEDVIKALEQLKEAKQ